METNDGRMYSIGDLARRAGLPVRTIRFWSDAGVVPETGRSPAGQRIYDDRALARLELVAEVAELHARALDAEIQALKLRRAVLLAVVRQGLDMEGMRMVSDLASLSAAERKRLVDDFIPTPSAGWKTGRESGSGCGRSPRPCPTTLQPSRSMPG